ncbi:related to nucleoside-diphosphate-sugar epimerases [Phialocephala subalpina]|uniref:Related to nucleoside-diphosphate-sugar epimerases n=1 Tax=Phialocephala subalpina TaxID=576137 RepID=A0A1L7WT04_9HELO|nr:related to nucleoside-diphosphate-sugar epimerases [Phialocephala subalpina]
MGKRVIFTGGSGKAGSWVVRELLRYGHQVLNLDLTNLDIPSVHTMKCDVSDAGQIYSAFNTQFSLSEPLESGITSPPDAVIHFAGYARPLLAPDNEVFRCNVMGFQNVLEAACKLGIKKIILASSVTTYGITYAQGQRNFTSFPIDEEVDCNPTDPYALSKLMGEVMARSFASRFNVDIYCFRIGAVIQPDEYNDVFEKYVGDPARWAVHGWSYTDARDLGQMCHRGLETNGLGWQVFNATNDTITNLTPTMEFLSALHPEILFTREMTGFEAPMSNKKIRELLSFREEHSWREYFTRWPRGIGEEVSK